MVPSTRKDATLPSVVAKLGAEHATTALSLTLLFHPDPERIGASWEQQVSATKKVLELGRHQPEFCLQPEGQLLAGLEDRHISRQALRMEFSAKGLLLHKYPAACRCRLQGEDISEDIKLDAEQLQRGLSLQVGHSVVLWLRLGPARAMPPPGAALGQLALRGHSVCLQRLRQQIARAAMTDLDVLVQGETGTGKELAAVALHQSSHRSGGPFVPINMAAIPESLASALLFGSAQGAYTGAAKATKGYFQQAHRGTLFLDEVGDTPVDIQPLLLRALQQRQVQVVGGAVESVDLRVIAATDAQLDGEGCNFSAALRHRLGSIEIRVPALREHPEDIGELLLHFLREAAAMMDCERLLPSADDDEIRSALWAEVFALFARYSWPGNVRELANAARQLLVASEREVQVPAHLLQRMQQDSSAEPSHGSLRPMAQVDAEQFRAAFVSHDYEVAATARALGVSRQSIYRRLEEIPDLRLASEVSDSELQQALAAADGDTREAARALSVSYKGLRVRLRSGTRL